MRSFPVYFKDASKFQINAPSLTKRCNFRQAALLMFKFTLQKLYIQSCAKGMYHGANMIAGQAQGPRSYLRCGKRSHTFKVVSLLLSPLFPSPLFPSPLSSLLWNRNIIGMCSFALELIMVKSCTLAFWERIRLNQIKEMLSEFL